MRDTINGFTAGRLKLEATEIQLRVPLGRVRTCLSVPSLFPLPFTFQSSSVFAFDLSSHFLPTPCPFHPTSTFPSGLSKPSKLSLVPRIRPHVHPTSIPPDFFFLPYTPPSSVPRGRISLARPACPNFRFLPFVLMPLLPSIFLRFVHPASLQTFVLGSLPPCRPATPHALSAPPQFAFLVPHPSLGLSLWANLFPLHDLPLFLDEALMLERCLW